ncbi:unnamed protein product [Blepharisma stoltei]|uniref:FYVE-type domain-containing protein n=1 Tax=Blepharisma stoltei TaxID=1481888 RepID=A0AAU9IEA7_9CILI|nr:unnamed protein product [Blepharisma stoltei]
MAYSSFSSSEVSEVSDQDLSVELPSDREQWRLDTQCKVCQMSLNIPGISHSQKNSCMFCYRGICAKCITKQAIHPETQKLEKMCITCSQRILITDFHSEYRKYRQEISELKLRINKEIENREKFSKERKTLEEDLENSQSDYDVQLDLLLQKRNTAQKNKEELLKKQKELEIQLNYAKEKQRVDLKVVEELENQKNEEKTNYENRRNELSELKQKFEELVALRILVLRKADQNSGSISNHEEKAKMQEIIEELSKQKEEIQEKTNGLLVQLNLTVKSNLEKEKEIEKLENDLNEKKLNSVNPFETNENKQTQETFISDEEEDNKKATNDYYEGPEIIVKMEPENYIENVKKSFIKHRQSQNDDTDLKSQIVVESQKCIKCILF